MKTLTCLFLSCISTTFLLFGSRICHQPALAKTRKKAVLTLKSYLLLLLPGVKFSVIRLHCKFQKRFFFPKQKGNFFCVNVWEWKKGPKVHSCSPKFSIRSAAERRFSLVFREQKKSLIGPAEEQTFLPSLFLPTRFLCLLPHFFFVVFTMNLVEINFCGDAWNQPPLDWSLWSLMTESFYRRWSHLSYRKGSSLKEKKA